MRPSSQAILVALASVALFACGGSALPSRQMTARQALTQSPEALDFETPASRQDMFKEIARASVAEAGRHAEEPVLFPIFSDGDAIAAPGFDARTDLLQAPDAGALQLSFEALSSDRWSEERSDSLGGLSEREAAELVARSLLHLWNVVPTAPVQVDRVTGAPYAAAYVDGHLRLNPAFVSLAATAQSENP